MQNGENNDISPAYCPVWLHRPLNADASVTHVDASKKTIAWAREKQALSGLSGKPIRWLIDDTMKFVPRGAARSYI